MEGRWIKANPPGGIRPKQHQIRHLRYSSSGNIASSAAASRSFSSALASICRTRSLVTPRAEPTSFSVCGSR